MDPNVSASPSDADNLARKKPIVAPTDTTGANTGDGVVAHVKAAAQNAGRQEFLASNLSTVRDASKREDPTPPSLPRLQPIVDVTTPTITLPGNGALVVTDPKLTSKLDGTTVVADVAPITAVQWHDVIPPSGQPTTPKLPGADSTISTAKTATGDTALTTITAGTGDASLTTTKIATGEPALSTATAAKIPDLASQNRVALTSNDALPVSIQPVATTLTASAELPLDPAAITRTAALGGTNTEIVTSSPNPLLTTAASLNDTGTGALTNRPLAFAGKNGSSDRIPVMGKIDFHPTGDQTTVAGIGAIVPVAPIVNQPEIKGAPIKAGQPDIKLAAESTNLLPPPIVSGGNGLRPALSLGTFVDSTGASHQTNPLVANISFVPNEPAVANHPLNVANYQAADAGAFNQALASGLSQNQVLSPAILQASLTNRSLNGKSGADILPQPTIAAYAPFNTAFAASDITTSAVSDLKFATSTGTALASSSTDAQVVPSQLALANTVPLGVTEYGKGSLPTLTNATFKPVGGDANTSPVIIQTTLNASGPSFRPTAQDFTSAPLLLSATQTLEPSGAPSTVALETPSTQPGARLQAQSKLVDNIIPNSGTNEHVLSANASQAVSPTGEAQIITAAYTPPGSRATSLSLGEIVPSAQPANHLTDASVVGSVTTNTSDPANAYLKNASFIQAPTVSTQLTNPFRSLTSDRAPELIQTAFVSPVGQPETPVLNNLNSISSPLLAQSSETLTLTTAKALRVAPAEAVNNTLVTNNGLVTNTASLSDNSSPVIGKPVPLVSAALPGGVDYGTNATPAVVTLGAPVTAPDLARLGASVNAPDSARLGAAVNAPDLASLISPNSPGTINLSTIPLRVADANAGQNPAGPLTAPNLSLGTFARADGSDPLPKPLVVANGNLSPTGDTTLLTSATPGLTPSPLISTFTAASGIFAQNQEIQPGRVTTRQEDALQFAANNPTLDIQQPATIGKITAIQAATFSQPIEASSLLSQTPPKTLVADTAPLAPLQQHPTVLASEPVLTNYEIPAQQMPLSIRPFGSGSTSIASTSDNSTLRVADATPTTAPLTTLGNQTLSLGNQTISSTNPTLSLTNPTLSLGNVLVADTQDKPARILPTANLVSATSDLTSAPLVVPKGIAPTEYVQASAPAVGTLALAEPSQLHVLAKTTDLPLAPVNSPLVEQAALTTAYSPLQAPLYNNNREALISAPVANSNQIIPANLDLAATPVPQVTSRSPLLLASASPSTNYDLAGQQVPFTVTPNVFAPTNTVWTADTSARKANDAGTNTLLASNTINGSNLSLGGGGIVDSSGKPLPTLQVAALSAATGDNAAITPLAPKLNVSNDLTLAAAPAAIVPAGTFASAEANQLHVLTKSPDVQIASSTIPSVEQVSAPTTFSPLQTPVFNNAGGDFVSSAAKINTQFAAAGTDLAPPPPAPRPTNLLASAPLATNYAVSAEQPTLSIKPVVYAPNNTLWSSDNTLARTSDGVTTSLAANPPTNLNLALGNGGIVEPSGRPTQPVQIAALSAAPSDSATTPFVSPKVNIPNDYTPVVATTTSAGLLASAESNQLHVQPKPDVQIASANLPHVDQVAAPGAFSPLQTPVFNNAERDFASSAAKVNTQLVAANTDLTPPPAAPKSPFVFASAAAVPTYTVPAEQPNLSIKPLVYAPNITVWNSDNTLARTSDGSTTSLASNALISPTLALGNGGIVDPSGRPAQSFNVASLSSNAGDSATTPLVSPKVNIPNDYTPILASTTPTVTFASAESNQLRVGGKGSEVQIASLSSPIVEPTNLNSNLSAAQAAIFNNNSETLALSTSRNSVPALIANSGTDLSAPLSPSKSPLVLASAAAPVNYDLNGQQVPLSIKPYGDTTANSWLSQTALNNTLPGSAPTRTDGSSGQPIYSQTAALSGQDVLTRDFTTKSSNSTDGQSVIASTQPTYLAANGDPSHNSLVTSPRGTGDGRTINADAENLVAKLGQITGGANANTISSQTSGGYARLSTTPAGNTTMLGTGDVHALTATTPTTVGALTNAPLIATDGRTIDALHATTSGSLIVLQGSGNATGPSIIQEVSKGVALPGGDKLAVVTIDASLLVGSKAVPEIKGGLQTTLEQPLRPTVAPGVVADIGIRPVAGNVALLDLNHAASALPLGPGGLDASIKAAVSVVKPPETDISAVKTVLLGQIVTGRLPDGTALSPNPNGIIFAVKGSGVEIDANSSRLIILPQRTDLIGQATTTGVVGATTGISNGGFSEIATVGLVNIKGTRTGGDGIVDGGHSTVTTNIAGLTGTATSKAVPLVAGAGGPDPLTGPTAAPGTTGANGQPSTPNSAVGLVAGPLGSGNPDEDKNNAGINAASTGVVVGTTVVPLPNLEIFDAKLLNVKGTVRTEQAVNDALVHGTTLPNLSGIDQGVADIMAARNGKPDPGIPNFDSNLSPISLFGDPKRFEPTGGMSSTHPDAEIADGKDSPAGHRIDRNGEAGQIADSSPGTASQTEEKSGKRENSESKNDADAGKSTRHEPNKDDDSFVSDDTRNQITTVLADQSENLTAVSDKRTVKDFIDELLHHTKRRTYRIDGGDTLEKLAKRFLKDKRLAALIYLLNEDLLGNQADLSNIQLRPGAVLTMPSVEDVLQYRIHILHDVMPPHIYKSIIENPDERIVGSSKLLRATYSCRFGDRLTSVAARHSALRDEKLWTLIAQLNGMSLETDQNGKPLATLKRAQKLILPSRKDIEDHYRKANGGVKSSPLEPIVNSVQESGADISEERATVNWGDGSDLPTPLSALKQKSAEGTDLANRELGFDNVSKSGVTSGPTSKGPKSKPRRIAPNEARIVAPEDLGEGNQEIYLRLEFEYEGKWMPVIEYTGTTEQIYLHVYTLAGRSDSIPIALPTRSIRELAECDLGANYQRYCQKFLAGDKPI